MGAASSSAPAGSRIARLSSGVTTISVSSPARLMRTVRVAPGVPDRIILGRSSTLRIGVPSTARRPSPACRPARSAGELVSTLPICGSSGLSGFVTIVTPIRTASPGRGWLRRSVRVCHPHTPEATRAMTRAATIVSTRARPMSQCDQRRSSGIAPLAERSASASAHSTGNEITGKITLARHQ